MSIDHIIITLYNSTHLFILSIIYDIQVFKHCDQSSQEDCVLWINASDRIIHCILDRIYS